MSHRDRCISQPFVTKIALSCESSCVKRIVVSNKAIEDHRTVKLIQILEFMTCSDRFIHRRFHDWQFDCLGVNA